MKRSSRLLWSIVCLASSSLIAEEPAVSFRSDVAPVLLEHCLACHGAKKAEGGYRVDSFQELLKPGDSGESPVVFVEGKSVDLDASELLRRITSPDESERMPAESDPLTGEQIDHLKRWLENGAKFDGEVESQPLALVIPPVTYAASPASYARSIPISAVAFSPAGSEILVGGYHEVTVWNASDLKLTRRIQNLSQRIFAMAFSSDGKRLAVACGEPGKSGEVRLVDFASGEVVAVVARSADVAMDVAFRPNFNQLAVGAADGFIRIIDTDDFQEIRIIASHADWVTSVAWSDDGSRLVSASRDKSVKVYDGSTGDLQSSYLGHGAAVRGAVFVADGKQVVSTGSDNKLHRWDIEGAKKVAEIALGGEGYKPVRSGGSLVVPSANHSLRRIDLSTNTIAQEFTGNTDWVLTVALQPVRAETFGEQLVVSGAYNGEARIWRISDGQPVHSWFAKP